MHEKQLLNPPLSAYRIDIARKNSSARQKEKRYCPSGEYSTRLRHPNKAWQSQWLVEFQRMLLLRYTYCMDFISHWYESVFLPRGGLSRYPESTTAIQNQ